MDLIINSKSQNKAVKKCMKTPQVLTSNAL